MVSPKEKAKEIYFSMANAGKGITSSYLAKKCAIILCNEMIEWETYCFGSAVSKDDGKGIKYWNKVKTELKLF